MNQSLPDAIDGLRKRARLYHYYLRAKAYGLPMPAGTEGVHDDDLAIMEGEPRAIEKRVIALARKVTGADPDPRAWQDAWSYVEARHRPIGNTLKDRAAYMRIFTDWADATKSYVLGLGDPADDAAPSAPPPPQTIIHNYYGDFISGISNSTVINRSSVERAFNKLCAEDNEAAAKVMLRLGEIVARSDDAAAGALFTALTGELQKPEPKKSALKSIWNGLVATLPDVAKLGEAVSKLLSLGSG